MRTTTVVRCAIVDDLFEVAKVFREAFPESLKHTFGYIPEPELIMEAFKVCLDAEPGAFFIAHQDNHIVGYVYAPSHLSQLWWTAITHGHIWRWVMGTLMGRIRIGWHPIRIMLNNKWSFLSSALDRRFRVQARILSIAVLPKYQGQGIAGQLMDQALCYLHDHNAAQVRLEVRPDNIPAIRLYQNRGFTKVSETHDTQGAWAIMVKEMER